MSSPSTSSEHCPHHVHFDGSIKENLEADNSIGYQKSGEDAVTVHLGFLQINHRYLLELQLPTNVLPAFLSGERITIARDERTIPNVNCKFIEFSGKMKGHFDLKIEFMAHKEKLLREELHLVNVQNTDEKLKLVLSARVLGRGKGTPMLRNGVHCVGIEADEESEASDWQGFSSQGDPEKEGD
ncbi:adipose-secreted signaling protein [Phlebotomus argentipes]|uniref:adipose-secreted signaling protein n=1 Tax=Phlebotomus argentipes TaxID=94469 RepID=UPI0028932C75|nr:adipose-secreted signaling protein [Phlebotomus argentipes]